MRESATQVPSKLSGWPGKIRGRKPMRVLVVEDDPALAVFLQKGLMLEGHEVDCVGDGDAALEMAAQQAPDLVVLDLGLPRRDGSEVLEILGRDFPPSLVLVLSGRSQVQERV